MLTHIVCMCMLAAFFLVALCCIHSYIAATAIYNVCICMLDAFLFFWSIAFALTLQLDCPWSGPGLVQPLFVDHPYLDLDPEIWGPVWSRSRLQTVYHRNKCQTHAPTLRIGSTAQYNLWPRYMVYSSQQGSQADKKLQVGNCIMSAPENSTYCHAGNHRCASLNPH